MALWMIAKRQTRNTLAGREGVIVSQTDSSIGNEAIFGSSPNAILNGHEVSAISKIGNSETAYFVSEPGKRSQGLAARIWIVTDQPGGIENDEQGAQIV
jgi:hypothetical protein